MIELRDQLEMLAKYRDALKEVHRLSLDLHHEIQEAKSQLNIDMMRLSQIIGKFDTDMENEYLKKVV